MYSFSSFPRIPVLFLALLAFAPLQAQINISLHPTAVPDSFEVRMHAIAPQTLGVLSGVFTLRWDAAAGGVVNASDIRSTCTAYTFNRLAGHPTTQGDYRYCTIIIDGRWALNDCPFTIEPRVIGTVRIRQLTGCRRVAIVNDLYAMGNNAIYYVSVGGVPQTGAITSQPLTSGVCPPCTQPSITDISAQHHIVCGTGPLELSATTTGGPMIYSWTAPEDYGPYPASSSIAWSPNVTLPFGVLGQYTLIVSNDCGSDVESLTIVADTVCIPPEITSFDLTPLTEEHYHFQASVIGSCISFQWTGFGISPSNHSDAYAPNAGGTYAVIVSNACGSDTASVFIEDDTPNCTPPQINALTYSSEACAGVPFFLDASLTVGTPDLQYVWTGPTEVPDGWAHVVVPNVLSGIYQLVVTNPCGSDTASLQVDVIACTPPEILGISQSPYQCSTILYATMAVTSCTQFAWTGPMEITSTSWSALIPDPVAGTYQLIATNACGSDTASLEVSMETLCTPPQISDISYTTFQCYQAMHLNATMNSASCVQLTWSGPVPVADGSLTLSVPNAVPGTYQLIASNTCGSDTAVVIVPPDTTACIPPEILNISQYGYPCSANLYLSAYLNPASCPSYTWTGPMTITANSSFASILNAIPGTYQVIVSNTCGSDTAQVVVQAGVDLPPIPSILGITSNGPICAGDTLVLTATVNDPNANFIWTAHSYYNLPPFDVSDGSSTLNIPNVPPGYFYKLEMTNTCGYITYTKNALVVSNSANPAVVCTNLTWQYQLENALQSHTNGGTWTFNGEPHDGIYNSGIDVLGTYYYHDALGCAPVPVALIESGSQQNGTDGAVTICSTDDPVELFPFIGGSPDTPGYWTVGLGSPMFNGTYYPSTYGGVSHFSYHTYCSNGSPTAVVTVTEIPATLWYQDLDNDGFGDPGASVLDCAPEGYVSNSTDNCPGLFGLISDACDDGLDYTEDDVITSECVCEGELGTGIMEAGSTGFRIWPNPTDGDGFFFTLADGSGTARIILMDIAGKRVMEHVAQLNVPFTRVPLREDIAQGLYLVRVIAGDQLYTAPLTVR